MLPETMGDIYRHLIIQKQLTHLAVGALCVNLSVTTHLEVSLRILRLLRWYF